MLGSGGVFLEGCVAAAKANVAAAGIELSGASGGNTFLYIQTHSHLLFLDPAFCLFLPFTFYLLNIFPPLAKSSVEAMYN